MHSSVKTKATSLLTALALGAVVLSGCSSKDTTKKKKDTGIPDDAVILNPNDPGTGSGNPGNPTGSSGPTCDTNQDTDFISPKCQSCLSSKCCDTLQGCFDITADGDTQDCNDYATCIDDCSTKSTKADRDGCYGACDQKAADGVASAYAKIEDCAIKSCESACTSE